MSLLVVSVAGDKSAGLLAAAGRARNVSVTELSYETAASQPIDPAWMPPGTRAILRDPWRKGVRHQETQRRLLAALPPASVLDARTLHELPDHEDKLFQFHALQGKVPTLASRAATRPYEGPYPVVLKRRIASGGRGTFLVRSPEELQARLGAEKAGECILQEHAKLDADYRILILGSRVVATVSRRMSVHEQADGARLAVKVDSPVKLAPEVIRDARRSAEILRCDFCGVDIVESRGRHFVIECNVSPQFRSTAKLVGQDIAADVVDFLFARGAK